MEYLIRYAFSFIGTPYKYGGSIPSIGMDCSEFCGELLKSVGLIKNSDDLTAQGIYDLLESNGEGLSNYGGAGYFAFYGKDPHNVIHVTFCIDPYRAIGANGGDANTKTITDAESKKAFIKIRPIKYRSDFLCCIKPKYIGIN